MADYKKQKWEIDLENALASISDDERSISTNKKIGAYDGGKKGGLTNKYTGHMKKIQKEAAHLGGKIMGPIQGKINAENKFWEKVTFEQRSKGGKIGGKKRTQMPDFHQHLCNMGKKSADKRISTKIEKYKSILKFIRKKEFTYTDMRNACEKYGIVGDRIAGQAKKVLREKTLVKQIHKGYNQFDPSLYIKVK